MLHKKKDKPYFPLGLTWLLGTVKSNSGCDGLWRIHVGDVCQLRQQLLICTQHTLLLGN